MLSSNLSVPFMYNLPSIRPKIWILAMAVSSSNIGISLLSPAVPLIKNSFQSGADEVQLVLTGFLVAIGFGQLVAGTLSDRFGRRPTMIFGALVFSLASLGALASFTIEMLILFRILQGFGAAACFAMGRVMINDTYKGTEAGKQLSTITVVQSVVPIVGFAFGGVIAQTIGWHGCIAIMLVSAAITFMVTLFLLPETNNENTTYLAIDRVVATYINLISNKLFLANAIASSAMVAMFLVQAGFMPYQFERYGIAPAEFGFYFCLMSVGYMLGNNLNRYLVSRLGLEKTSLLGTLIAFVSCASLLLIHVMSLDTPNTVTFALIVMGIGHGLSVANTTVSAVRASGKNSGAAMGLVGASQMFFGGILGTLIIALGGNTNFLVAVTALTLIGATGFLAIFISQNKSVLSY